jgi:cobalamin biosynthesis protein CbiG
MDGTVCYDTYRVKGIEWEWIKFKVWIRRDRDWYEKVIACYTEKFLRLQNTKEEAVKIFVAEQKEIIEKAEKLLSFIK